MPKHIRIRTKVGSDKAVTVNLNQDFDMLEILSLNMHQTDVYPRNCADFGVVVGRVVANGGFGVPNAKISIFLPLDDEDNENEVIKQLYPYRSSSIRDEDGYVYNLLPQDPSYNGHVPTGNFPKVSEVLLNQEVKYVYEKYYKLTAKTNESGDFMIYGVPPGSQRLVMNLDLSDMGCFSMVPEDFKLQGAPESAFDGARFRADSDLGSLPQIAQEQKSVDVKPFWGDEESGCDASITRMDFDLRDLGIEIKPTAVFMGSMGSDDMKDSVNKNCRPRWKQGELCLTIPQPGTIEAIRWTPFWKEEERPSGFTNNPGQTELIPVMERFNINGGHNIDEDGAFLINVPMNLDYLITNEFGEQIISDDPEKGIPTKGKYRFRIKPENTTGNSRLRRRGAYLVPNIREYNENGGSGTNSKKSGDQYGSTPDTGVAGSEKMRSYAFSINYYDYPQQAIDSGLLLTCKDYFYEFSFNKVYTTSQFINYWKHRHRDGFVGIKEVIPRESEACDRNPFPINTASRNVNFAIIFNQFFTRIIQVFWQFIWILMNFICLIIPIIMLIATVVIAIINVILGIINFIKKLFGFSKTIPYISYPPLTCEDLIPCAKLRVTKYPECQKCGCTDDNMNCSVGNCTGPADTADFDSNGTPTDPDDDFMICNGPDDQNGSTTYAADGCYLINFQSIIGVILTGGWGNFNVPQRWRRVEVTMRSLCDGLLNYYWKNNWINGFLYNYQFKAKLKPDNDYPNGYKAKFCAEVMHFDPIMQEFYYRSCPTDKTGNFIGDPDTALRSNNTTGGFLGLFTLKGENRRNIHQPTTIQDLGPVQEYIGEICNKKGYREGCSISDDLAPTTFSNPGNLIFAMVTERIVQLGNWDGWNLGELFRKEHKQVGGDMGAIFSQFNEVGVIEYEELDQTELTALSDQTDLDILNAFGGDPPTLDDIGALYAPDGWYSSPTGEYGFYGDCNDQLVPCGWDTTNPNPSNCTDNINNPPPSVGSWGDYSLSAPNQNIAFIAPRILYPVDVPEPTVLVSPGSEIRECIVRRLSASSQTVPVYLWNNDLNTVSGTDFIGTQAEFNTTNSGLISINYQGFDTWQYATTPIFTMADRDVILGTGYHYYFGLIPGSTAYDIFVKKYVPLPLDELEEDELFVI